MKEIEAPTGVHPNFARVADRVFTKVNKVGGDIEAYRAKRKRQRTWKDHNETTMYLT
jgi:hypothetical protein